MMQKCVGFTGMAGRLDRMLVCIGGVLKLSTAETWSRTDNRIITPLWTNVQCWRKEEP